MPHDRLPDKLDSNARVEVRVNGVVVGTRRIVDLVGGITGIDDGVNDKVTLSLGGSTTGVGYWKVLPGGGQPVLEVDLVATGTLDEVLVSPRNDGSNCVDVYDNGGTSPGTDTFININTEGDINSLIGRDLNINATRDVNLVGDNSAYLASGTAYVYINANTIFFNPTLDNLLVDTGVVAGTYGTSVKIPRFTVDAKGRLSGVTELPVPTPSPDHLVRAIFDHYANVGNGTTVETDLYTDTLTANLLANNGDKIEYRAGGTFVNSATATRELKLYFGGTAIFDTGTLTISAAASWDLEALFIRVSSSVVRYTIKLNTEFAALSAYTAVGELTGLTLSNTQVVKITGQAAGVGAATNDIVAKVGSAMFWPAV